MSYFDPQLMFYLVLFVATMLFVQGTFTYVSDKNRISKRVNGRMKLLTRGASSEEILSALRRDAPNMARSLFAPPKIVEYLEIRLTQAGMKIPVQQLIVLMLTATLTIGVAFPLIGNITGLIHSPSAYLLVIIFAAVLGIVAPLMVIASNANKRMAKFEEQFPIALDILVRGLRAGHPVTSALELLVSEVPDPIGSEFGIVVAEMNYGYDLRGALTNLAARVRTQDIQMFVVSVSIQAETGGSLADILDGLSRVIRERASMALKVRALSSEGKMTGTVLSLLPVATFCFVFGSQPSFYLDVIDDPWFMPGFMVVGVWYALGVIILNKLTKIKI